MRAAMSALGNFYRENGESPFVDRLEGALPVAWSGTRAVAAAAGVSYNYARKGLEFLREEGRVEKRQAGRRLEWRLPCS